MTAIRPRRSVLYMPGSNARAIEKARGLDCDAVILDLEDAVAPDEKDAARRQVCDAVIKGGFGRREVVIRVNATDTPWGERDLAAAARARPDAILLPKVSDPQILLAAGEALARAFVPDTVRLWAMIETPLAILSAYAIAAASREPVSRLACLVLGTNDLAKETRARATPGRLPMLSWLSTAVAAARSCEIDVLDGVYNDLSDMPGYRAECEQGRDLGFDGKTLIHPSQIADANQTFAPPSAEVAQAKKIIAAFERPENAGLGVINLDGRMVERLHADMARRTVALAQAIGAAARAG